MPIINVESLSHVYGKGTPFEKVAVDGIDLEIDTDALREIARKAVERKTGARGLRTIVEEILSQTMFEAPSDETLSKVVVTAENVKDGTQPQRINEGRQSSLLKKSAKKNAS